MSKNTKIQDFAPLANLPGGAKVPALAGNRVLFRDGRPVATLSADKTQYLVEPTALDRQMLRAALVSRADPGR